MKKSPFFLLFVGAVGASLTILLVPLAPGAGSLPALVLDPLEVPVEVAGKAQVQCNPCSCCLSCDLRIVPSGGPKAPNTFIAHTCADNCDEEGLCPGQGEDPESFALAFKELWDAATTGGPEDVRRVIHAHGDMAYLNLDRGSIQLTHCNSLAGNFPIRPEVMAELTQ